MGRCRLLRLGHGVADVGEVTSAERVAHHRKELFLLLVDMVADILDEHRHLCIEALMGRVELGQFGKQPLDHVMLLEAFERDVLRTGHGGACYRIKNLLLDCGVHRKLFDDPVDDLALFDQCVGTCLLEALEQRLDGLVVVAEKCDRIHERPRTPTRDVPITVRTSRLPSALRWVAPVHASVHAHARLSGPAPG